MDVHLDGIERKLERLEAAAAAAEIDVTMSTRFRQPGDDGPPLELIEADGYDLLIVRLVWPDELDG